MKDIMIIDDDGRVRDQASTFSAWFHMDVNGDLFFQERAEDCTHPERHDQNRCRPDCEAFVANAIMTDFS